MRNRFLFLAIILLIIHLNISCASSTADERNKVSSQPVTKSQEITVTGQKIQISEFDYIIASTGKIKPLLDHKILSNTNGLINYCSLKNGRIVKLNELLIRTDTKDLDVKLKKARANIFNFAITYQSDLLSQESLLKGKGKGIRDTVYRRLKAKSGLTDAEMDFEQLELEKSKSVILSSFSGMLADVKVQSGMYIKDGDELFRIYSEDKLLLNVKILEEDISLIKIKQGAIIYPTSNNYHFAAEINEINPTVDENGMVEIKLLIRNPKGLLPGMNARAEIHVPQRKSLTVPKQAVVMRSGKPVVFTIENGHAKWNDVQLGLDNGREIEIKSGLQQGNTVVLTNNIQLSHDARIKMIKTEIGK